MKIMKTRTLGEKKNMWKIIAIILIIVDLVVLCLKGCGAVMDKAQSVPEDYTKKVQTGGDIEAKYLAMGTHEVSYKEIPAMMSFKKYEIFYPSDMADTPAGGHLRERHRHQGDEIPGPAEAPGFPRLHHRSDG